MVTAIQEQTLRRLVRVLARHHFRWGRRPTVYSRLRLEGLTGTPEFDPGSIRLLIRPDWALDFIMKRTKHMTEQIILKLKTDEQFFVWRKTVVEVCRVIYVTQPTYHRWR